MGDISIPINIQCSRNKKFNHTLQWVVPYDIKYEYKISSLLKQILNYINNKNKPMVFIITKIASDSFIGIQMNHTEYCWDNLNADITYYTRQSLMDKGLVLEIDIDAYKHILSPLLHKTLNV